MSKSDQILITGATGFVGSYLLRMLVVQGYTRLRAMKRAGSRMDLVADIKDKVEWVDGDILDVPFLEDAMAGCVQVYHCAAIVTQPKTSIREMMRVNVQGTANVVNVALYSNVSKLLYISSIAALGRHKRSQQLDESNHWQRNEFSTDYGVSKYLGEQEVWRGIAEGLNAVIINPSVIIGSGYWQQGTAKIFDTVSRGLRFYPPGKTGFVDVRDVAKMCIQLMESELKEVRVIANAVDWTYLQFFKAVATAIGKKPPTIPANALMSALAWRLDWLRAKLTGGHHVITKSRVMTTSCSYAFDNSLSKDLLGFEYRDFEETVRETGVQFLEGRARGVDVGFFPI
jgi:dihydroflavonol-4-reductase